MSTDLKIEQMKRGKVKVKPDLKMNASMHVYKLREREREGGSYTANRLILFYL